MKALIHHQYSELDKCHKYYCDTQNNWTWFGIGQSLESDLFGCLYPFLPYEITGKVYTITAKDAVTLGYRCAKKLDQLFKKYGK